MPVGVALGGPSGVGKTTVGKALAERLPGYHFVSSGWLYRAAALAMGDLPVEKFSAALGRVLDAHIVYGFDQRISLNGVDITDQLELPRTSERTPHLAKIPEVRQKIAAIERSIIAATHGTLVLEGRNTKEEVWPDVGVTLYIDASVEARTLRRCCQLESRGLPAPFEFIRDAIAEKDRLDRERAVSPFHIPEGAIIIDCSDLTFEETVERLYNKAREILDI